MAESDGSKGARKLPRPTAFGNRIQREAAEKARAEKPVEPAPDDAENTPDTFFEIPLSADQTQVPEHYVPEETPVEQVPDSPSGSKRRVITLEDFFDSAKSGKTQAPEQPDKPEPGNVPPKPDAPVAAVTAEKTVPMAKRALRKVFGILPNPFNYFKRKQAAVIAPSAPVEEPVKGLAAVAAEVHEPAAEPENAKEPIAKPAESLEAAAEAGEPMYSGVTFDSKYDPILMFAAGEKAVVNAANKRMWEKTLEDLDLAYETAEADKKLEAGDFRNYIFAVYASAAGDESKDKEILVYVLSELASAEFGKGEFERAFAYAKRASQIGEAQLLENPSAEALHKWGMLEHNIEFYDNQLKTAGVEAE